MSFHLFCLVILGASLQIETQPLALTAFNAFKLSVGLQLSVY